MASTPLLPVDKASGVSTGREQAADTNCHHGWPRRSVAGRNCKRWSAVLDCERYYKFSLSCPNEIEQSVAAVSWLSRCQLPRFEVPAWLEACDFRDGEPPFYILFPCTRQKPYGEGRNHREIMRIRHLCAFAWRTLAYRKARPLLKNSGGAWICRLVNAQSGAVPGSNSIPDIPVPSHKRGRLEDSLNSSERRFLGCRPPKACSIHRHR